MKGFNMNRLVLAISLCSLLMLGSAVSAQESAKVQVTIKISAKTPSFKDQRLVVMLYHDFPLQDDRGPKTVDKHIDTKFSHEKGKETVVTITLGEKAKLKRDVQYTVNVYVYDGGKRTHFGELDGEQGPFNVLTNGRPSKLTLVVRAAP